MAWSYRGETEEEYQETERQNVLRWKLLDKFVVIKENPPVLDEVTLQWLNTNDIQIKIFEMRQLQNYNHRT